MLTPCDMEAAEPSDVELQRLERAPERYRHELLQHQGTGLLLLARLVAVVPEVGVQWLTRGLWATHHAPLFPRRPTSGCCICCCARRAGPWQRSWTT